MVTKGVANFRVVDALLPHFLVVFSDFGSHVCLVPLFMGRVSTEVLRVFSCPKEIFLQAFPIDAAMSMVFPIAPFSSWPLGRIERGPEPPTGPLCP